MVKLSTSDGEEFTVDKDVAERSVLIKQMLEGKFAALMSLSSPADQWMEMSFSTQ